MDSHCPQVKIKTTERPIAWPTNWPTADPLTDWLTDWVPYRLNDWSSDWPIHWLNDRLTNELTDRLTDWFTYRLPSRPPAFLLDLLIDCLIDSFSIFVPENVIGYKTFTDWSDAPKLPSDWMLQWLSQKNISWLVRLNDYLNKWLVEGYND